MSGRTTLTALLGMLTLALAASPAHAAKTTTCDPVDPRACLLPWPNNHFTTYNINTETRRQMRLPASTPRNAEGKRIDPSPVHAVRRLLARQPDPDLRPGARPAPHRRRAAERPAQLRRQAGAGRADRRADAQAPADLGRARLRRQARRPAADDPPGEEPRRGPALHRRAAQPQGQPRAHDQGPQALLTAALGQAAHRALRQDLPRARPPRRRALLALPGLGLHGRQPAQHQRARHLDPRQRVRRAGRLEPRQPPHQGRVAGLQDRLRAGTRAVRRRRLPGGRERRAAAPRLRHADRRLLPRQEGLPARLRSSASASARAATGSSSCPCAARATPSRCRSRASSRASP